MKSLVEQSHYEVLEVPEDTTREEVERAYQLALDTFSEDSLAGYSIFEAGDAGAIRERVEEAYRVLSDDAARSAYDAALARERASHPPIAEPPADEAPRRARSLERIEAFEEPDGEFDGARLRRARLRASLEIDDVAKVTKINPNYLRYLEEESYARLPARVYVRGFVAAYASCVGLDPRAVATSYLSRFDRQQPAQRHRPAKQT